MFPFIISFFICIFSLFFPTFPSTSCHFLTPTLAVSACFEASIPHRICKGVQIRISTSCLQPLTWKPGPKFCSETQKHLQAVISSLSGGEILHNTEGTCWVSTAHPKKKKYFPLHHWTKGVLFPALPRLCGEGWKPAPGCPCPVLGVSLSLRRNVSCLYWSWRKTKKYCMGFLWWRHHMETKHRRDLSTTELKEAVARLGSISSPK